MPFVWGYYDGREYRQFKTGCALARFLETVNCVCYAHNGGKFDFHYLLPHIAPYDDLTIINGRIARFHLGRCELRDSICILPVALAAYQKDEIDYAIFERGERDKPRNREKISAYLQSDCRYLWQMVTAFHKRFGDNLTQAGAAMKQWQKISKANEIEPADRTDKEFYDALSPYYYGGRVECFKAGVIDTDFAVFDINSAYPYAMLQLHPYSANFEEIDHYVDDADFYSLSCRSRGVFPYRGLGGPDLHGFGLSFPNDAEVRTYHVSNWEYRAALDTQAISEVHVFKSLRFARRQSFAAYIQEFWEARRVAKEQGDTLGDIFAKLMMNSLYGKWAANPDNYRNYIVVPRDKAHLLDGDKCPYSFGGELGPWALGEKSLDEAAMRYYNVATGASITGFVRAMLWRAIHSSREATRKAGLKYGVLYVDTDSIACEVRGSAIHLGDALGQWKCEGHFDRAGIAGKKLYVFRGRLGERDSDGKRLYKTASKGVRLTRAELWRVAAGGSVDYRAEVPTYSVHKPPAFVNRTIRRTA